MSYSHIDKSFANRLVTDLRQKGHYIWIDDSEIKVGDSLIEKIREGIDSVDYLGAIISQSSINSYWVKKELDVAMNQEIQGKKIKVLPILLNNVDLPGFLLGKKYADFTDDSLYDSSLEEIVKVLDEVISEKSSYSPKEAKLLAQKLESLEKQLSVSESEKGLLLSRLNIERKVIDPELNEAIQSENKNRPEIAEISRNFGFMLDDIPVTAGYILHVIDKERLKGGPHQIVIMSSILGKTEELFLLARATSKRLEKMSNQRVK
ncbi:MAG: toll/interleukin-1 receptor domain-containing protein [Methanosarcina barkeri]|nr:toll/interleukin-1 receptor domain-containing protein [Methanosarcina sp. ERenArc_MAG2]